MSIYKNMHDRTFEVSCDEPGCTTTKVVIPMDEIDFWSELGRRMRLEFEWWAYKGPDGWIHKCTEHRELPLSGEPEQE